MRDVVIVEAVRTPTGRRNGGLSTMHSLDLLGAVQRDLFIRSGVDPLEVGFGEVAELDVLGDDGDGPVLGELQEGAERGPPTGQRQRDHTAEPRFSVANHCRRRLVAGRIRSPRNRPTSRH